MEQSHAFLNVIIGGGGGVEKATMNHLMTFMWQY